MSPVRTAAAILLAGAGIGSQEVVFPAGKTEVDVPMRQLRNGWFGGTPQVEVAIGDRKLRFLVDTGAGACLLDKKLVLELGLVGKGRIRMQGTGRAYSPLYQLPELRLGAIRVRELKVLALDLKRIGRMLGGEIHGLIGSNVFAKTPVTFDFEREKLTFHEPASFVPPAGVKPLAVLFALSVPTVRARVAGRAGWFLVDTGNQGGVILFGPFVRKLGLAGLEDLPLTHIGGVGKANRARLARLPALELAGTELSDVPANLVEPGVRESMAADSLRAGNIGSGILERFRMTLDFAHKRVYLEPREGAAARFEPPFGMTVYLRRGKPTVRHVYRSSPAHEAGLKLFDVITRIDGEPAPKTVAGVVAELAAAKTVRLELDRPRAEEPIVVALTRRWFMPRIGQ